MLELRFNTDKGTLHERGNLFCFGFSSHVVKARTKVTVSIASILPIYLIASRLDKVADASPSSLPSRLWLVTPNLLRFMKRSGCTTPTEGCRRVCWHRSLSYSPCDGDRIFEWGLGCITDWRDLASRRPWRTSGRFCRGNLTFESLSSFLSWVLADVQPVHADLVLAGLEWDWLQQLSFAAALIWFLSLLGDFPSLWAGVIVAAAATCIEPAANETLCYRAIKRLRTNLLYASQRQKFCPWRTSLEKGGIVQVYY